MEKEIREWINQEAKGRPYNIIRQVGNRIEVMFYGDYAPIMVKVPIAVGAPITVDMPTAVGIGSLEKHHAAGRGRAKRTWSEGELPEIKKMRVAELREVAFDLGIQTYNLKKAEILSEIVMKLKEVQ